MRAVISLIKRNVLIFMRDKSAVFFSVLSMLIVLGLMVLFLGEMNSSDIVNILERIGGDRDVEADRANARYLVQMWTLAGILLINCVTVTMTVMDAMIEDESTNRLSSFYVAPVKHVQIALGYIVSAWFIGIGMCLLTLAAGEGYMIVTDRPLLAGDVCLKLMGMVILNTFLYASIAYLLAQFIHSTSAWSGLLTIVGTLVGFVGGTYLPMAAIPEKVAEVLKYLPVLHGSAMMRNVCTKEAVEITFAGLPEEAVQTYNESMGVSIVMNEKTVSFGAQLAYLVILSIAVIAAATFISRKKAVRDR